MASQRPELPAGAPAGRARLLLVEDDPSIRRFVGMALEDLAVEVVEAGTLGEARLALAQGEFALLLTDLMLPDGHGLSLLGPAQAQAQAEAPRTGHRVIVFSAGISQAARLQALARGAWRVLDKPVPLAVLSACVQDALAETTAQRSAARRHRARHRHTRQAAKTRRPRRNQDRRPPARARPRSGRTSPATPRCSTASWRPACCSFRPTSPRAMPCWRMATARRCTAWRTA